MVSDIQVIDSHWHLYICQDEMGRDFRAVIEDFKQKNGLSGINLCAIPVYNGLGPAQNILAALYKLHDPTAYAYGGLVYPQCPFRMPMPEGMDPLSQYRELMALGFDGIKMLETKPTEQKQYGMRIDDGYYDAFFAACERDGTHMVWHVADPDTFWDIDRIPKAFLERGWFYGDGTYLSHEEVYGQVYRVLEAHPKLKVTFAHFFFHSGKPQALEQLFHTYPGVSVDLTPGSEMYADFRENRAFYRDFFIRHADRILYGTDTAVKGDDMERFAQRGAAVRDFVASDREVLVIRETAKGLELPVDVQKKILGENFRKAAGATPRPVDRQALRAYMEKYQHLIPDEAMRRYLWDAVNQ